MAVTAADNSIGSSAAVSARRRNSRAWIWWATGLSGALGVLLALSIHTTSRLRNSDAGQNRLGVSSAFVARYKEQNQRLQQEIMDLRRQVHRYETNLIDDSSATESLKKRLEALRSSTGVSAVTGPGLRITLRDATDVPAIGDAVRSYQEYMVHDHDLNDLLRELKLAGARALAISGADPANLQRVIVTTTARCVGPSAVVNGTPLAAPYHILAIGDAKALRGFLERPGGYIRERGLDRRKMVSIDDVPRISLPEYSGKMTARYAKPAQTESEQ